MPREPLPAGIAPLLSFQNTLLLWRPPPDPCSPPLSRCSLTIPTSCPPPPVYTPSALGELPSSTPQFASEPLSPASPPQAPCIPTGLVETCWGPPKAGRTQYGPVHPLRTFPPVGGPPSMQVPVRNPELPPPSLPDPTSLSNPTQGGCIPPSSSYWTLSPAPPCTPYLANWGSPLT